MKEKVCEYCNKKPGAKPGNKFLWNGLLDKDTNQLVCFKCREKHYKKKSKTKFKYLYTEFPVMLNE
ncbi:MAG TPA: hypothetical protein DHV28_13285 [Ignavibacteriales bacterium]|nr:hypothetical protein [Ignavibacteriales bacterium]